MRYSVLFISSCVLALQHVGYAFGQHMVTRNFSPWNAPVLLDAEVEGLISLVKLLLIPVQLVIMESIAGY